MRSAHHLRMVSFKLSGTSVRTLILSVLIGAAASVSQAPAYAAAATDPLFRSTGPEIRFRCGSETLRAKLRGGRLVVQSANGERAILLPVTEPRAVPQTPSYGDGRLTLYKIKDSQVWALARTDRPGEPAQHCTPQRRLP